MSRDLGVLATRNKLATLAYLLDIARLEAETAARQNTSQPTLKNGVDVS